MTIVRHLFCHVSVWLSAENSRFHMLVVYLEVYYDIRSLLVDNGHVTTPTERWLVDNVVIDTYVQRTWPVK